ncbi:MAG: HAD family hydrolase [Acidobacteriota bacterium]|nr:MAG: HAD family hydrolase [Acidobacteriota bacterium]
MRGERLLPEVDAVLFDLDGTLIDSADIICHCFNKALSNLGIQRESNEKVRKLIGRPLREMFASYANGVSVEALVAEYRSVFSREAPGQSSLLPGAAVTVQSLSSARKLGIVTSRSGSGTLVLLKEFGLIDHFSTVVGAEHVERFKPDPEPVMLALRQLGIGPSRAVLVGDTVQDVLAAHSAGAFAIGITTGADTSRELQESGADFVIDSLTELLGIVDGDGP